MCVDDAASTYYIIPELPELSNYSRLITCRHQW